MVVFYTHSTRSERYDAEEVRNHHEIDGVLQQENVCQSSACHHDTGQKFAMQYSSFM